MDEIRQAPRIAVIGGINIDITATAQSKMIPGDSNPGDCNISFGGVGRNIAENLSRLGADVSLVTALGQDAHTESIRHSCEHAGIDLTHSRVIPDEINGLYVCLNDVSGDLYAAVSDMRICERITPEFLLPSLAYLCACDLVVVDANLPETTLQWLAQYVTAPIAADPVSIRKAGRLKSCLYAIRLLKPNRPEAELLTGVSIRGTHGLDEAAAKLHGSGVDSVFISLGSQGVFYSDHTAHGLIPAFNEMPFSTNGCGDAMFAAICISYIRGLSARDCAKAGQAAAAICAQSANAVSDAMSPQKLEQELNWLNRQYEWRNSDE